MAMIITVFFSLITEPLLREFNLLRVYPIRRLRISYNLLIIGGGMSKLWELLDNL